MASAVVRAAWACWNADSGLWELESVLDQGFYDVAHVAVDVFERQVEAAVEQDLLDRGAKPAFRRVVNVV